MTSAVNDIVAGGLGGMVCKLFEFPLDTLKVQLQTQSEGAGRAVGPLTMLRTSVRKHGALGLYRGLPGPLAASMAENAVLFLSYGAVARLVDSGPKEDLPAHKVVVCSLAAAFCVSAVLTPVELVKCRMQTAHPDAKPYKNTLDCLVRTVREEGPVRGLFAGHTSTLARECPGNIAWFMGYEIGCRVATPAGTRREELSPLVNCGAGALAGMMYWFVPFPADVVKSKIQTGTHGLPAHVSPSFMTVFQHVFQTEGVRGFYRGCGITVARAAPGNGLLFVTYEWIIKRLPSENENKGTTC